MDVLQSTESIAIPNVAGVAPTEKSYDEIPYGSHAIPGSHPDRLYNVARLFGIEATPPSEARVLELGCAGGGNIIPIASQFPKARCVGVDLSKVQCDNARIAIRYAKLDNIEIVQSSIGDLGPELGKFDYIICHGVYSWVPDEVRESILRISSQNLAENGVAFISYNVLPGWHFRGMIREMMLRHVADITDNRTKILQARALLDFLTVATQREESPHALYLRREAKQLNVCPDEYVFHEFLENINNPFYFKDFMRDASRHALQYLGESNIVSTWPANYSQEANAKLGAIQDPVLLGHYLDCLAGRAFRETLLVHQSAVVDRNLTPERLQGIRFKAHFKPTEAATDSNSTGRDAAVKERSYIVSNKSIVTSDVPAQAIIDSLNAAYPNSIELDRLEEQVRRRLDEKHHQAPFSCKQLVAELTGWMTMGIVQFQFHPDRMVYRNASKPKATSWARCQAEAGSVVTNLQHRLQQIDELKRLYLPMLNGLNDAKDLAEQAHVWIKTGVLPVEPQFENQKLTPEFAYKLTLRALNELAACHLIQAE